MGIATKKKKYRDDMKPLRRMAWISFVWGVLYLPLIISAGAYGNLNGLRTLFLTLAAAVFCLPLYILPVYFSKHYPKGNKPRSIMLISSLVASRYLLYPILAFLLSDDNAVIYGICGFSVAALIIFAFAAKKLWQNNLQSVPVYINTLFNIIPIIAAAAAVIYSAFVFGRTEGGAGDIIGSVILSAALSLGEILLHISLFLFCKRGKATAKK